MSPSAVGDGLGGEAVGTPVVEADTDGAYVTPTAVGEGERATLGATEVIDPGAAAGEYVKPATVGAGVEAALGVLVGLPLPASVGDDEGA